MSGFAAERGTIDDVIMPNATRRRRAGKFTQPAPTKKRAHWRY
jgi:hypothetical protein